MPDEDIDTSDIPEVHDWSRAERGKFYRPGVQHHVPVYQDPEIQACLGEHAAAKGMPLSELTNELLKRDIEVVTAVGGS